MNKIEGELVDKSENDKKVSVKVEIDDGNIYIHPEGYGDCSSQDGYGYPLMIEIWEGELRVVAWSDINEEDPTDTISLEGAREELRKT